MSDKSIRAKARPTLKTIAYMTGLGISTVSRALKDGPEIGADTKARVNLIARQIGYRPNRAGVRLKTGKTNVISVVLNAGEDGAGFFTNFVYGISDALVGTSYHLVVTPYSLSDPMAPVRYVVETGSADGVIISRTQPDDPRVRYLLDMKMPFATHGRTEMGLVHPYHDYANEVFARVAAERLAKRGRRNIALVGPPPGLTYAKHTQQGLEAAMASLGQTAVPFSSVNTDTPLKTLRAAARQLAERTTRPDGFVCSAVHTTFAVVAGFADAGLKLGRDFDVATKHSNDILEMALPEVISIPEDFRNAGSELARMVMAWIEGEDPATLHNLVSPESFTAV